MARLSFNKPQGLTTDENALAERLKAGIVAAHTQEPFTTTTLLHAHLSKVVNPRMYLDTTDTLCKVVMNARHTGGDDKTILTVYLS